MLYEVITEADLSGAIYYSKNMESYIKQIENAVRDFHDFIRDHRSMDYISLSVNKIYEERCSHCGYIWETDTDGTPLCCQEAIDEFESSKLNN